MRPCSIGTSSGWRAADSRNFEPMMADAETGAERTEADHDADGQSGEA